MTTEVTLLTKGKKPIWLRYKRLSSLESTLRGRTADVVVAFGPVNGQLKRTFEYITASNDGEVVLRGEN